MDVLQTTSHVSFTVGKKNERLLISSALFGFAWDKEFFSFWGAILIFAFSKSGWRKPRLRAVTVHIHPAAWS